MYASDNPRTKLETHDVLNQPTALVNYNLFQTDPALVEAVQAYGLADSAALHKAGADMGSKAAIELGFAANKNTPELTPYDRYGQRIDEVCFHPAYHDLMTLGKTHGVHSAAWTLPKAGHVAHAALEYMLIQTEAGVCCPLTMTYASIPTLRKNEKLAKVWVPLILRDTYDASARPASGKTGVTIGMAMTEKQGGSDVRSNTTEAKYVGEGDWGAEYALTGHKWFCSAPMSDGFLTLAQTSEGLTCFFVPRWKIDGTRNIFEIQRLKDKLGNRSNASAEIHYNNTFAVRVGEEGRGVPTIIEMVNHTRLDCAIGSAGLMRQAVVQAMHHTSQRKAFGKVLAEQPPMQNLLADMAIESEAATHLALRVAQAFDHAENDEHEAAFARLAVAIAKFWITKRLPNLTYEAMECLGGNGYIEDFITPRLYREAPVNSIWEGAGNVICLDILRTLQKETYALAAYFAEVEKAKGKHAALDAQLADLKELVKGFETATGEEMLGQVRPFTEKLAVTLQAALLLQNAPKNIAKAFCETRLAHNWGYTYGTLPTNIDPEPILKRQLEALKK